MATIYEEITPALLATKWSTDEKQRTPFLGEALFPERKQLGIELSYLQGAAPTPRPLDLSSFDAKAIPLSREAFSKVTTQMPFFKNFLDIDEKQRQDLNMVLAGGNRQYIDVIVNRIFNDNARLLANADITREMLRMQLLTTGTIAFASNGQAISYDFGVPSANKVTSDWSASTADPIADINGWADDVQNKTGVRPDSILLNRATLRKWIKLDSIKNAVFVWSEGKVTPNTTLVQRFVEEETNMNIYVYDKGYTDESTGNFVKFVADNVVVLFDSNNVGEGVFGTTPEESDLMTGAAAEVSIVDVGVAITATKETDPVNVKTKVSMIYLPVLTAPETLVIADVSGS